MGRSLYLDCVLCAHVCAHTCMCMCVHVCKNEVGVPVWIFYVDDKESVTWMFNRATQLQFFFLLPMTQEKHSIHPLMYMTEWFMCIFSRWVLLLLLLSLCKPDMSLAFFAVRLGRHYFFLCRNVMSHNGWAMSSRKEVKRSYLGAIFLKCCIWCQMLGCG